MKRGNATSEQKFRSNLFTTIFLSSFLRHFSTMYSLLFPPSYGTRETIRNFKKNRLTLNFSSGTGRTKGDPKLLSSLPSFRQSFLQFSFTALIVALLASSFLLEITFSNIIRYKICLLINRVVPEI